MRKTFQRSLLISAFRCDLDSLGTLVDELLPHFTPHGDPWVRITCRGERGEELEFDSVEDLRAAGLGQASLQGVRVSINVGMANSRRVSIDPMSGFDVPVMLIESNDNAWNAAVAEIVLSFAQRHAVWWGKAWYVRDLVVFGLPIVAVWLALRRWVALPWWVVPPVVGIVWSLAKIASLGSSSPRGVEIVLQRRDGFVVRHRDFLASLLPVIAILIALLAWLFPRTLPSAHP